MRRREATLDLVRITDELASAHMVLPVLLEAKQASYNQAYNDALNDGHLVTSAREHATQAASAHIVNYERQRAEIASLAERAGLLRFLLEHDLFD